MELNLAVFLIGLLFFSVGVLLFVRQLKSKKNDTEPATATVIDYYTEISQNAGNDGESVSYYPVMRYFAAGQWYEKRSDIGRGKRKYETGAQVEILYDPEMPENFIIAGDRSAFVLSVLCMCIGAAVCVLSFFAS